MGYDATNTLPAGVAPDNRCDRLEFLGYRRTARDSYWYSQERSYQHLSGIWALVSQEATVEVHVSTWTKIGCRPDPHLSGARFRDRRVSVTVQ